MESSTAKAYGIGFAELPKLELNYFICARGQRIQNFFVPLQPQIVKL